MSTFSKNTRLSIVLAALFFWILPMGLYWHLWLRAPSITVDEARMQLERSQPTPVLLDIRATNQFTTWHLEQAVNWPCEHSPANLREITNRFPNREILLLCQDGLASAMAVKQLRTLGHTQAWAVSGGLSVWTTRQGGKCLAPKARSLTTLEQILAAVTGYGIKPFYMGLCLVWIVWLWRCNEVDLAALRWGLTSFLLGELACMINYLVSQGYSDFWEFGHNYGMAVGFSLITYAVLEGVDHRLIKLSVPTERCAGMALCKLCIKHAAVSCGFQRLFRWLIPATMLLCLIPLCAPFRSISYNAMILGEIVNYANMASSLLFEIRYAPILALLLLAISWGLLLFKKEPLLPIAKLLFAGGIGFLSFGLARLFLVTVFSEKMYWFVIWEEWTELVFVAGIGLVLALFRQRLFHTHPRELNSTAPATT